MKIVFNACYGGFGLSDEAFEMFCERTGLKDIHQLDIEWHHRTNPVLIDIIEQLGIRRASGPAALLLVAEIPDDYGYSIEDYDGVESIYLSPDEDRLLELIRQGNEDAIVDYVMRCGRDSSPIYIHEEFDGKTEE